MSSITGATLHGHDVRLPVADINQVGIENRQRYFGDTLEYNTKLHGYCRHVFVRFMSVEMCNYCPLQVFIALRM